MTYPLNRDTLERLTIAEAMEYEAVWQTAQDLLPDLSRDELALIVSLVVNTCPVCHENARGCQCWNDE